MGDRGNIAIIQHPTSDLTEREVVFFYGHWAGYRLNQTVAAGLERGRDRWGDEPYLGRILFTEMIKGGYTDPAEALTDNLSFGISTYLTDNEYPILVIDDRQGKVFTVKEEVAGDRKRLLEYIDNPANGVPFEEFIASHGEVGV